MTDLEKPTISLAAGTLPVIEKNYITLICSVANVTSLAESSVAYKWTKTGSSTPFSEISSLALTDVNRNDAGNYTCEAYNTTYGLSSNATFYVSVHCEFLHFSI